MSREMKGECGSVRIVTGKSGARRIKMKDGRELTVSRMEADEVLSALSTSLRPFAGLSIFEKIMTSLDAVIDRMMAGEEAEDGRDPGRAEAYTMALAILRNPYSPDYPAEKERQMERWESRNEE